MDQEERPAPVSTMERSLGFGAEFAVVFDRRNFREPASCNHGCTSTNSQPITRTLDMGTDGPLCDHSHQNIFHALATARSVAEGE
jgi:hypothetical protein